MHQVYLLPSVPTFGLSTPFALPIVEDANKNIMTFFLYSDAISLRYPRKLTTTKN